MEKVIIFSSFQLSTSHFKVMFTLMIWNMALILSDHKDSWLPRGALMKDGTEISIQLTRTILLERIWESTMFTGSCQTQSFPNAHPFLRANYIVRPYLCAHIVHCTWLPCSPQSAAVPVSTQTGYSYFAHYLQ